MKPHVNIGTIGHNRTSMAAALLAMTALGVDVMPKIPTFDVNTTPTPEADKYQQERIAAAEAKRQRKALKRNPPS